MEILLNEIKKTDEKLLVNLYKDANNRISSNSALEPEDPYVQKQVKIMEEIKKEFESRIKYFSELFEKLFNNKPLEPEDFEVVNSILKDKENITPNEAYYINAFREQDDDTLDFPSVIFRNVGEKDIVLGKLRYKEFLINHLYSNL